MSRHESSERQPDLETLLGYEILFGAGTRDLYAGVFQKVENKMFKRARRLARKLDEERDDPETPRKLEALRTVIPLPDAESAANS